MRELLELLEHDARRPVNELAAILHRSEYEVDEQIKKLEKDLSTSKELYKKMRE